MSQPFDTAPPEFEQIGTVLGSVDAPKTYPPGTVVALAGEAARYSEFAISLHGLIVPPGSSVKWILGSDIPESRNNGMDAMEGEWIWFIDDDHAFHPETLLYLLDREVDIVTPNCLRRNAPFLPVATEGENFLDLRSHGPDDLVEVTQAGSSGMLIRRPVVEALSQPYFELGDRENDGNRVSEDVQFCRKAREAGFSIHVDLSIPIGHLVVASVWPSWNEEQERWMTTFSAANNSAHLWIEPAELPEVAASPPK